MKEKIDALKETFFYYCRNGRIAIIILLSWGNLYLQCP